MKVKRKLLFLVNDPGFFLSHRLSLAEAARTEGFDVHVATASGVSSVRISKLGFWFHPIPFTRSGQNPLTEFFTFLSILRLYRKLHPDLVHLVTIKPVIYGGIAARMARVPGVIAAISGLGFLFVARKGLRAQVIRNLVLFMYRFAMGHHNQCVIFQNQDDMNTLSEHGGVSKSKSRLIRGSGVNLQEFTVKPEPDKSIIVVMASRLLKDKGVHEFVEAARIIKACGIDAKFQLIGMPDCGNPESISNSQVEAWHDEGIVECLGYRTDIPELFSKAHIVTLPSYYGEGLPKVLVEAAACGRPVVTTNTPGCRDAITPGVSGILVPVRDAKALASAIRCLAEDSDLRMRMGKEGRKLAEKEFSIEEIVKAHIDIYRALELNC